MSDRIIHSVLPFIVCCGLLCLCFSTALADEETEAATEISYLDHALSTAEGVDDEGGALLWSSLPRIAPAHTFALQIGYRQQRIDSRFRDDGRVGEINDPITISDPYGNEEYLCKIESEYEGNIRGLDIQTSYHLTETLAFFADIPLRSQDLWLRFEFSPGSSSLFGVRTKTDLFQAMENLGRPRPKIHYRSKTYEMGDLRTGLAWHYLQSEVADLTLAAHVSFPTGRLADPNQALIYGLGPEIDVDRGAFAPGATHRLLFSLPGDLKWIGFLLEAEYQYFAKSKRRTPRWLEPDPVAADGLEDLGQTAGFFPDLSDADDFHYVTLGSRFNYVVGLSLSFPYFSVGFGYGHEWSQEPELDAEEELVELLDMLGAYREQSRDEVLFEVGIPLEPIYFPGVLGLGYRHPVAGRNAFRLEDNFTAQLSLILPF